MYVYIYIYITLHFGKQIALHIGILVFRLIHFCLLLTSDWGMQSIPQSCVDPDGVVRLLY